MRVAAGLLALLTVCAVHAPVRAQERGGARVFASGRSAEVIAVPDAVPGAVVSAVLRVERPAGATAAVFEVAASERVLLYGARSGDVVVRDDVGLVPLTFSVPRETAAGLMQVARVDVRWADGTRWSARVETRVVVRRGLELALDTGSVFVARGMASHVGFVVRNSGNAADTVQLVVLKPESWAIDVPGPIVVGAGASRRDSVRIRVPASAAYDETQIVRVTAEGSGSQASGSGSEASGNLASGSGSQASGSRASGRGSRASGNLAVTVAEPDAAQGGLLRLPGTITVGALDAGMLEQTPVSVALEMQGSLGSGTEASLLVRRSPHAATPPAFYRYVTGPALRAEVRNGQNRIAAGDVLFVGSSLHGGSAYGTGLDGSARLGSVQASVFAARPQQFDAPQRPGHLLGATAGVTTTVGVVGVSASDMARPAGLRGQTEQSQVAALTFRGSLAHGLSARAEAGLMTLRDADGRAREGVAIELGSAWRSQRIDLQGHVRRVPGSLATSASATDETFLGGGLRMGSGFALNGWLVRNESELLNGAGSRYDGGAVGLRWHDGGASAQVSGYLRRTSGTGILTARTEQRSIAVGGSVPLGPLTAEGTLELGRAMGGDSDRPLRHITSRLSYQAGSAWAWLSLSHSEGVFGSDLTRLDAGSITRAGRIELEGRLGTWLNDGGSARVDAWLSGTVHVTPRTALIAGVDYAPWRFDSDPVRLSLGARHSLGVPLPFRRRAQVHGVIYEDDNGNRQRDAGERGVQGVRVRRGNTFATTDEDGRFAFYSERAAAGELSLDAGSLAHGLMLLPNDGLPARGTVDVPVVRAAALRIHVFEDRNDDAARSPNEAGAGGAMIELTDADGRTRTASAGPEGTVSFAALPPGEYSLRARITAGQQGPGTPVVFTLRPGETTSVEIGAPKRVREIRFGVAPVIATDTAQVDTVTTIQADGHTTPVRSADTSPRAGAGSETRGRGTEADGGDVTVRRRGRGTEAPGADAPVRRDSADVATPGGRATAPAAPADSVVSGPRAGYGSNGWPVGLGAVLALLLLFFAWRRRTGEKEAP